MPTNENRCVHLDKRYKPMKRCENARHGTLQYCRYHFRKSRELVDELEVSIPKDRRCFFTDAGEVQCPYEMLNKHFCPFCKEHAKTKAPEFLKDPLFYEVEYFFLFFY